jgi:hypothetical protein
MKLSIAFLAFRLALAVATPQNPCATAISRDLKDFLNIIIDDGCVGTCPAGGDDGAGTRSLGGGSSGDGGSLTNNNALAGLWLVVYGGVLLWEEF